MQDEIEDRTLPEKVGILRWCSGQSYKRES